MNANVRFRPKTDITRSSRLVDGGNDRSTERSQTMQQFSFLYRAKSWSRSIKRDVVALWLAARDPRVPWYAKAVAAMVAAYALSPIDLIPDFIPVLGYLDDLLIVPLGIMAAVKLIPPDVMNNTRTDGKYTRIKCFNMLLIAARFVSNSCTNARLAVGGPLASASAVGKPSLLVTFSHFCHEC